MALFGRDGVAQAQTAGAQAAAPSDDLQEVVVSGLRYSFEQSIDQKRAATSVVDVVTAEDIGKMPDKNVADSLQRLPGVNVSTAGANEGGFDEADRVSIRGTNPSYTQTLINGHFVASGDWFVLDQTGTVGRSVSYTLLPSELVSQVVVQKSAEASLVEGGIAGAVNIVTRKPLEDFKQDTTIEVSAGAVYADLPSKTSPQASFLANWINADHNFGVMLQGFTETRELRRDGQELLGYEPIDPLSPMAAAHPDLAGVVYPKDIGSALFQQHRQRNGGLIDIEWRVNDNVTLDASGFYSKLNATNVNDNYLLWATHFIGGGQGQAPLPGYVVQNGTLVQASFAPVAGTAYGVYDQISRPDESASSNFGNLDAHIKVSDALSFFGQTGVSIGHGRTPEQDVSETNPGIGSGAAWVLNGLTTAANWNLGNTINTTPSPGGVPVAFGWIFGDQNMDVVDREVWAKLDGDFKMDSGVFKDFSFGARYADHQRHLWGVIGQGPGCQGGPCPAGLLSTDPTSPFNTANYPVGFSNYPSGYASGIGSGFPTGIWFWTPDQLRAYDQSFTNRDPISRADWSSDYGVEEKDAAIYVQLNFGGEGWAGNVGVRGVQTKEDVISNVATNASDPRAITTSAFGPYYQQTIDHTYNNVLPSANIKFDLTKELVARFAVAETLARPDYSALAGAVQLGQPPAPGQIGGGSGGNPDLKPIKSTNFDAGLEWYFAPRSILAGEFFYMDLRDYIGFGTVRRTYMTFSPANPAGYLADYDLSVPFNSKGRVTGAELSYQQLFFDHWGVNVNYTYADGKQTQDVQGGDDRLVGTSKNTFNSIAFYENKNFSARIAYTYRSEFLNGLDRSTAFSQAALGTWSASLGYTVNDHFAITLDGLNLNNPTLKYFGANDSQPRAFYKNGSQYYLTARFKL